MTPRLNQAEYDALKVDILADPVLAAANVGNEADALVQAAYNTVASPPYWVWKTSLAERAIYEQTSPDATTWNWQTYIAQNVAERDAWGKAFAAGGASVNPSLPQTRIMMIGVDGTGNGQDSIFQGTGAIVVAQRNHLKGMMRRLATRAEKFFHLAAGGNGAAATPATMGHEGSLTAAEVVYTLRGGQMP